MYKGYKLDLKDISKYLEDGIQVYNRHSRIIKQNIDKFISPTGVIEADKLSDEWFPEIKSDIFISHSHKDKDLALALSGWLHVNFELDAFVDHAIWGHADVLQKNIDDAFCYQANLGTYSYEMRNQSTAHVHMMLSAAIAKVLNNCECLFFLNTPNSINAGSTINDSLSFSPWLYYEISLSKLIQKPLEKHTNRPFKKSTRNMSITENIAQYPIDLSHLTLLKEDQLNNWLKVYNKSNDIHSLDILYNLTLND